MKLSNEAFQAAVRRVVREELRAVLPTLIAEALADRYLKKALAEVAAAAQAPKPVPKKVATVSRPRNLRELMQGDAEAEDAWEEDVPRALPNDHRGIYHQNPMVRGKGSQRANESVSRPSLADIYGEDPSEVFADPRFQERDTPEPPVARPATFQDPGMAALFEGTSPVPTGNVAMGETQKQFGEEGVPLDFLGKIGVNFNAVARAAARPEAESAKVDESRLRQLENQRKALDTRRVG